MTEHTYRDTTWRAELMGSEGWAVFTGPRMLASNLPERHARLIAAAPELLEALKRLRHEEKYSRGLNRWDIGLNEAQITADEAIRKAEPSSEVKSE